MAPRGVPRDVALCGDINECRAPAAAGPAFFAGFAQVPAAPQTDAELLSCTVRLAPANELTAAKHGGATAV